MTQLTPCGRCARHVRPEQGPCPFCGAAVSPPPRTIARHGATRAAVFYLGATLAACGAEPQAEPTVVQPYGAPPSPDPPEAPEAPEASDPSVENVSPQPIDVPPPEVRGPRVEHDPRAIAPPYGAPPPPPPPEPGPQEQ